ncbi:D-alanyl-D-alanine carboxypeptidase family protein [Clostridium tyrobutyricum]|uniref:D-alanyl-D-alanine carboxypeptidase family protein n=1 Tax=Clostridium tyrobutyricum TaxID=1519 RepID=UPI0024203FB4|nr:D-alanyl-D-alanine carboxypeptidase family protein [Clostridium tyrobutyricum]
MKKIITLTILLLLLVSYGNQYKVYALQKPPSVSADSAVVLDATTGEVLYSKNPDSAYPPASTTKIMTALLVFENTNLNSEVTVGKNPPNVDGTRVGLIEGEKLTVRDLLYGLLLASDNDCAEALAEYVGNGSMGKFVDMMNDRALELGANHTHFVNPSGLFNKDHKTSAKDLALIMEKLSANPEYSKIATTLSYTIKPTNKSKASRTVWNENRLVQKTSRYYYEGAIGGKTGYTIQSLHSYVASAVRGDHKLIVSLVHDKNKTFFPDSIALFNYGFNNFKLEKLYSKGDLVTTYKDEKLFVPLKAESDFYYTKPIDSTSNPKVVLKNTNLNLKSFNKGDFIENANVLLNGKNIGTIKLASGITHESKNLLSKKLDKTLNINITYSILGMAIIFIGGIIFLIKKRA